MAKKIEEPKVMCQECKFGGIVDNFLIDCSSKDANPDGYKKGTWAKACKYYVKKAKG